MTCGNLINLDTAIDRWHKCNEEFKNINTIKLKRFSAIRNTNGHIGCFLSHLEILKNNFNDGHVLILEDDVNITDKNNFDNKWTKIKQWLDDNEDKWDVFNGGPYTINNNKLSSRKNFGTFKILNDELKIVQVESATTSHFVYYNKNVYEKIKDVDYNIFCIDRLNDAISTLKIVTIYPYLAYQHAGNSFISDKFVNFVSKMKKTEQQLQRRLIK